MFKIKANPTFPATVKIRAAGGEVNEFPVVFKHMPKDDVKEFFRLAYENKRGDAECLLDLIDSWDADMELSIESINELFKNYRDSAKEMFNAYMHELIDARLGN